MTYLILGAISFLVTVAVTEALKRIALHFDVTDKPRLSRKIHRTPIPLLGGVAVGLAIAIVSGAYFFLAPTAGWPGLSDFHVAPAHLIGLFAGAAFLLIGGALDDIFELKPHQQAVWPLLAVFCVIASGIGIESISNPFGGTWQLDGWKIPLFELNGSVHSFTVWSDLLTAAWLLTVIYTTKFLDGLDGLVAGVTAIGASVIALVSLLLFINIPTALLSVILTGAALGFLVHNFHPAKIFLGEAGSTLCGYMLGVLAIISGAKFATALLILGFPILDAAWVIFRRVAIERRSPFVGDRKHLHFRLLDSGLSHRQSVGILYAFSLIFGALALFLQSAEKLYALLFLGAVMAVFAYGVVRRSRVA